MLGGVGDFFASIGDVLKNIFDFLVSLPNKIADALKWLFDLVVDAVGAVASGIWGFFKGILGTIGDGISWLVDFFGGMFDMFVEVNRRIFIPRDDYMSNKMTTLRGNFNSKINIDQFSNAIEVLKGAKSRSLPQSRAVVQIYGANVSSNGFMQIINDNLDLIHMVVRAFTFLLLIRFNVNKIHKLIRGTNMFGGDE